MDQLRRELPEAVRLLESGRLQEAGAMLERLGRAYPLDCYVLYNTGLLHWRSGRTREAIAMYRRALGANPNLVQAMTNLGSCLVEVGDLREAIRYFQMALRRRPQDPYCLSNLATALIGLGEAADALAAIEDALKVAPDHLMCLRQRMVVLVELHRISDALDAGLKALSHPEGGEHVEVLNTVINLASKLSRWDLVERYTPTLHRIAAHQASEIYPMSLTFTCDDPGVLGKLAHDRSAQQGPVPARPARAGTGDRITIGYMSPDLREHPVAHMLLPVLQSHDRSAFRILTIGTLPPEDSPITRALAQHSDGHIDLTPHDDSAAVHELRSQGVDVLVDLAGNTRWCRPGVLAKRPCAAQVLWLGCPCSTGTKVYDAFLVDEVVAPAGYDAFCTEPLVRLPCCYHPISTGLDQPAARMNRRLAKLPENCNIVGVVQQPSKIHPPFIDQVVAAVARHAQAHLAVRVHAQGLDQVQARFTAAGLPTSRHHLLGMFKERSDYLALHRLVDVVIDSYPYGGHSTTGEALIQGTPVLTLLGRSIHARVAASMLHELGLDELVFEDFPALDQYLGRLLEDPRAMADLRHRCQAAAQTYARDGVPRLTRALEQTYRGLIASAPVPAAR
jgi:predicted O-linked N-acetylglucosamine transferase (SPINDLY family)